MAKNHGSSMPDSIIFHKVLISPPEIVFQANRFKKSYMVINIMNISRETVPLWVKRSDGLQNFSICGNVHRKLAPGLSEHIHITFQDRCFDKIVKAEQFTIHIDENLQYIYHLKVVDVHSVITVQPTEIDFESIDIGSPAVFKQLIVKNTGQQTARVNLVVEKNQIEISAFPISQHIFPNSESLFNVKLVPLSCGVFIFHMWIATPQQNISITIRVRVIMPEMIIHHPNTTGIFTLVDFGHTYFGLENLEIAILQNISSEKRIALVLGECEDKLLSIKDASKKKKEFNMFEFLPDSHNMSPFEGMILFMKFKPKLLTKKKVEWKHKIDENEPLSEEFFIFVQIARIHCMDIKRIEQYQINRTKPSAIVEELKHQLGIIMTKSNLAYSTITSGESRSKSSSIRTSALIRNQEVEVQALEDKIIRICLHGVAERAAITLLPDCLNYGQMTVGDLDIREVRITNMSPRLPIFIKYSKARYLEMLPLEFVLDPKKSREVAFQIHPLISGHICYYAKIQLFWWSAKMPDNNSKQELRHLRNVCFKVQCDVINREAKKPLPIFNMGITPMFKNEVGRNIENIRFDNTFSGTKMNKPPKVAMMDVKGAPLYFESEQCHDLIAFPNDIQRSIRPWPRERQMRTIFTGVLRYAAPLDTLYQLTPQEIENRKKNQELWKKPSEDLIERAQFQDQQLIEAGIWEESSNSMCEKLYKLLNTMPPLKMKPICVANEDIKMSTLLPLSPMQLYNIVVSPKSIDFGLLVVGSKAEAKIDVTNFNNFPIQFNLFSIYSHSIKVVSRPSAIIGPKQSEQFTLTLLGSHQGRYDSHVNYTINSCHSFQLIVYGNIMEKVLLLPQDYFEFPPIESKQCFYPSFLNILLVNTLKTKVEFSWYPDVNTSFHIRPKKGTVPAESGIYCNLYYKPSHETDDWTQRELATDSDRSFVILVKAFPRYAPVKFVNNRLDLGLIPLNILNKKYIVLHNSSYHEAVFWISNPNPFNGLTIRPHSGLIKARAIYNLEVEYCIRAVCEFKLLLYVYSGDFKNEFEILGKVEFPLLKISPEILRLRRIFPFAYDRLEFSVTNKCLTIARLQFGLDDFPEYVISRFQDPQLKHLKQNDAVEINPSDTLKLFLHFRPRDVATLAFEVPILVNGMLGRLFVDSADNMERGFLPTPVNNLRAQDSRVETKSRNAVAQKREPINIDLEFKYRQVKTKLPELHIKSCISKHLITFSEDNLFFLTIVDQRSPKQSIDIINKSPSPIRISLCLRDVVSQIPQFFVYSNENPYDPINTKIFIITLEPEKPYTINVDVLTKTPGFYRARIPVFVEDYIANPFYTILALWAECQTPSIRIIPEEISFRPLSLNCALKTFIRVEGNNLPKPYNLKFSLSAKNEEQSKFVKLKFPLGTRITPKDNQCWLPIMVTIKSNKVAILSVTVVIETEDEFSGISSLMQIHGIIDNCSITTFAYCTYLYPRFTQAEYNNIDPEHEMYDITHAKRKIGLDNKWTSIGTNLINHDYFYPQSMPIFPNENDDIPFSDQIIRNAEKTLKATQRWLFEQAFHSMYYFEIPDGVIVKEPEIVQTTIQKFSVKPNIFNLIVDLSLCVKDDYFIKHTYHRDEERVMVLLGWLRNALELIKKAGGSFCHTKPEFLLSYEDYLIATKKTRMTLFRPRYGRMILQAFDPFINNEQKWVNRHDMSTLTRLVWTPYALHDEPYHKENHNVCTQCYLPYDKETFYKISKFIWMHFILQIFKSFFLYKVCKEEKESEKTEEIQEETVPISIFMMDDNLMDSPKVIPTPDRNRFSNAECILLEWLQRCYNENYMNFSKLQEDKPPLAPRIVLDFENSLDDGIIFCVVTFAYCPYLATPCFLDIFLHPTTIEEANHNATRVIYAWSLIKLSFTIIPMEIVCPNSILMVMLVYHLYEILPSLLPRRKILFAAALNNVATRKVKLLTSGTCTYRVHFIGDNASQFSVTPQQETLSMEKGICVPLVIYFTASHIATATATLILSGTYCPGVRAYNLVFDLVGIAQELHIHESINIEVPLYTFNEVELKIHSPYTTPCLYEIYYSNEEPTSSEEFDQQFKLWKEIRISKVPRCIFIQDEELDTSLSIIKKMKDKKRRPGMGDLRVCIGVFTSYPCRFWLAFLNEEIGDFIVEIEIIWKDNAKCLIPLVINLPKNYLELTCRCEFSTECPLRVMVPIPCRNPYLWECLYTMFKLTLNETEYPFWDQYFDSPIGMKLLSWLTIKEKPSTRELYISLMNKDYTYCIKGSIKDIFNLPEMFTITDVRSYSCVMMPFHLTPGMQFRKNYKLTLISENHREIRTYKVRIKKSVEPSIMNIVDA